MANARWKTLLNLLIPLLWMGVTVFSATMLFRHVDLKPKVEQNFFFSSDDPQFREDRRISELFPAPQQIIIAAKGDLRSPAYYRKIRELSYNLWGLAEVFAVQSLAEGPENVSRALESALWRRMLIAEKEDASNLLLFLHDVEPEEMIPEIEAIVEHYQAPDFKLLISGPPYIVELIRRNLLRDLKVFSVAAIFVFAIIMLFIFRSFLILLGTLLACFDASILTLFFCHWMNIPMGPLTANLSTIVFVLTLSHIAYMTFNWKQLLEGGGKTSSNSAWHAVKVTFAPSFWSMLTTFLGFLSLIFVQATPLKRLGVSGSLGTLIAFLAAYGIYPWFLVSRSDFGEKVGSIRKTKPERKEFFAVRHFTGAMAIILMAMVASTGLGSVNTDPSLLSYFKKGSELRLGLEYMDRNGGSSPLNVVISDPLGLRFDSKEVHEKLWKLQLDLEKYPSVGSLISLALVLTEARGRVPLSNIFPWKWVIGILKNTQFTEIARFFVTDDRLKSLLIMRMHESGRTLPRPFIVSQVRDIIENHGFRVELMGGVYLLQGKLARLVTSSLLNGLAQLISLFVLMGFLLSRSVRVTVTLFLCLLLIPAWLLGLLGHFHIPVDMISAPATNLAIAMGVDAMIHLLMMVKRCQRQGLQGWNAWAAGRASQWKPILSSSFIIAAGFSIFCLSNFPPTQRFGFAVICGTVMAPLGALFVLPVLAGVPMREKPLRVKS